MFMVFRTARRKPHLDAAALVAMDFLVLRPHHDGGLRFGPGKVDPRIVGRNDRNPTPHTGKSVRITHAAFGTGLHQAGVLAAPAVQGKQPARFFIERLRQIVLGFHPQFGAHEFALGRRMPVDFGMSIHAAPLPDPHVPVSAFPLKELGLVFLALHAQHAKAAVIVAVGAGVRRVDQIIVDTGRKLVAHRSLVGKTGLLAAHRPRLGIVPAVAIHAASRQAAYCMPGRDAVTLLGAVVAVVARRPGRILFDRMRMIEQHQRMGRGGVMAPLGRDTRLDVPCNPAPLPQAPKKGRIRLVVLHREFAGGVLLEPLEVELESRRRDRIGMPPFTQDGFRDVDFAAVAEHPRITGLLEQG